MTKHNYVGKIEKEILKHREEIGEQSAQEMLRDLRSKDKISQVEYRLWSYAVNLRIKSEDIICSE